MALEWIVEPVDDDEVCGPDLEATDDPAFLDYYYDALGGLPDWYVKPGGATGGEDAVFKHDDIDIKAENKQIEALLKRSRDIRLLVLKAQLECLAGRITGVADAIKAIADLTDARGDAAHPVIDGSASDRRSAINDLSAQVTMVLPMQFIGLNGSSEVTLRKLKLARGDAHAYSFEEEQSTSGLQDALGSPTFRKQVDDTHAAVLAMTEALDRIARAAKLHESHPFSPDFAPLLGVLGEIRTAITDARPDLRGAEADLELEAEPEDRGAPDDTDADAGAGAGATQITIQVDVGPIASHNQARQALEACEGYFRAREPSSAAVLLITQARLLIGQPLIVALETLLPQEAARAMVEFGPQTGFAMNIDRLRALSNEAPPVPHPEPEVAGGEPVTVASRPEAAETLRQVERFFRDQDKSSAVPILLQRARSYLDKDFQALVDELLPPKQEG